MRSRSFVTGKRKKQVKTQEKSIKNKGILDEIGLYELSSFLAKPEIIKNKDGIKH
jgi:hypothetical protein